MAVPFARRSAAYEFELLEGIEQFPPGYEADEADGKIALIPPADVTYMGTRTAFDRNVSASWTGKYEYLPNKIYARTRQGRLYRLLAPTLEDLARALGFEIASHWSVVNLSNCRWYQPDDGLLRLGFSPAYDEYFCVRGERAVAIRAKLKSKTYRHVTELVDEDDDFAALVSALNASLLDVKTCTERYVNEVFAVALCDASMVARWSKKRLGLDAPKWFESDPLTCLLAGAKNAATAYVEPGIHRAARILRPALG